MSDSSVGNEYASEECYFRLTTLIGLFRYTSDNLSPANDQLELEL